MLALGKLPDMYRTPINIFGDSYGEAVVARSEVNAVVDQVVT